MKSITTRLRPGYLRKNGVPYSANTVFTEYWDLFPGRTAVSGWWSRTRWTIRRTCRSPWITSVHFKKEPDGAKWDPTPCSARF